MKIFRWLFSNLFLILLIVTVTYSYMYWGNLAGRDTPAGKIIAYMSEEFVDVEDFFHAIKEKQAELSEKQLISSTEKNQQSEVEATTRNSAADESNRKIEISKSIDKKPDTLSTAPVSEPEKTQYSEKNEVAVELDNNNQQQQPVSISYRHNQTQIKPGPDSLVETVPSPAAKTTGNVSTHVVAESPQSPPVISTAKNKDIFVPAEVEDQLNIVNQQGKIIGKTQQKSSDVKSTWINARRSFYQRNYELSEQSYLEVIESTEDNFDAYGELGNVYFNQGKNREAASAYFEAAVIMIGKGQARRAKSLLGLLRHLDRSKAEELQKLIDSVNH